MAQFKSSTVSGNVNVTTNLLTDEAQVRIINAPISSGSSTYDIGSNGQVLRSNGTTVYWASDTMSLSGVKGNSESSYRTGQVNITPANIGAVAIAQGTDNAGKFLTVDSSGNIVLTAL